MLLVAAPMDNSVRTALTNLQGLLDEGFVTQQEFQQRRKAILDSATSVKPSTSAAASASGKSSVFSRLGNDDATGKTSSVFSRLGGGGGSDDKWGHDKYIAIHGGGGKKAVAGRQSGGIIKPLAGGIAKHPKGDLRSKLSGGGGGGGKLSGGRKVTVVSSQGNKSKLPAKCPW